ncbi:MULTISPECIES: hypothetical protein [Lacticaseibacillus]|uniref:Uncharacterized protein n=7 Tax=Lacticaseibacillus TaxID=2759736 RepID=A0AAN1KEX3_LACCA|nr:MULTISPECIES: hypothetical protein [Lacticaseibacillus]OFR93779.1 hypothetical protein HMPREF2861_11030 [Lactobacillus sp. HMSC068F07]ARY92156.1 hypothetical protein BGL52_10480 [Lacticaseibacillus casei]KAB1971206.1 hypothetical protein F9B82_01580 [Lacticaseibacillus casei]KLI75941.1 hypothetical protein AAW28_06080 [Lacticaseibacillus casei]KRK12137.1 hypothetical protein FD51_GL000548 [Lacticaseibacillus zeae DSM 20178 = KCTC 3804]
MKLYQGLTQVQVNEEMADDAPDFNITTDLVKPLHYSPSELYRYLDAVLKPGSRHDQNNLKYVTDAAFIGENFDFNSVPFTAKLKDFESKMAFARNLVSDLNRHVSVNINTKDHAFELLFVD